MKSHVFIYILRDRKLVEAAGIEPASVSTLPSALHACPNIRFNYWL